MPALPPNSLIVVTGITGYIASHVGLAALQAGHRVRGTVRSTSRADSLKVGYEKQGIPKADLDTRLEFVIVDDLSSEEQYLKTLQGADGVAHVALALSEFQNSKIIDDAIDGTLSLLKAAKRVPSIQRVVITSSSTAAITPPIYHEEMLTDKSWNDEVVRIVENNEPTDHDPILRRASPFFFYGVAKTKAEKAAWKFVEDERPQFDLVSVLPNTNFGPVLHGEPPSTAGWLISVMKNDLGPTNMLPSQWYVDVRDCGKLHILGLTTPSLGGKRIWAAAEPWGWNAIFAIIRKHFPSVQVPEDLDDGGLDRQKIDNTPGTLLLGKWIGLEQSVVDLAKSMGY